LVFSPFCSSFRWFLQRAPKLSLRLDIRIIGIAGTAIIIVIAASLVGV
jgi:hypothetical protein